jgi:hypothetical protein
LYTGNTVLFTWSSEGQRQWRWPSLHVEASNTQTIFQVIPSRAVSAKAVPTTAAALTGARRAYTCMCVLMSIAFVRSNFLGVVQDKPPPLRCMENASCAYRGPSYMRRRPPCAPDGLRPKRGPKPQRYLVLLCPGEPQVLTRDYLRIYIFRSDVYFIQLC